MATVRYTELNSVRARLCGRPEAWTWSSARAHLVGLDAAVAEVQPMLDRAGDWWCYLSVCANDDELESIRRCSTTGRPAGDAPFIEGLEALTERWLKKRKPGPKTRN